MNSGLPWMEESETRELFDLIRCEREASLDEQQQTRLAELVAGHSDGHSLYFRVSRLEADLHWYYAPAGAAAREFVTSFLAEVCGVPVSGSDAPPDGVTANTMASTAAAGLPMAPANVSDPGSLRSPVLGFLGTALGAATTFLSSPWSAKALAIVVGSSLMTYFAALAISVMLSRSPSGQDDRAASSPIAVLPDGTARIIAMSDCRWQDESPAPQVGMPLPAGRLSLLAGIVELEFDHGARVRLEGPAGFAPRSVDRIELSEGRLAAYVPRRGRGFTVETPTAEVIDLGTEFGVEVDERGTTDLHVVRGQVEVKSPKADSAPRSSERLTAGEAIRISAGAAQRIAFDVNRFRDIRSTISTVDGKKTAGAQPGTTGFRPFTDGGPIWISNLFDDPPGTPLAVAIETDSAKAILRPGSTLAVERLVDSSNKPLALRDAAGTARPAGFAAIAPGIVFDLSDLGWQGVPWGNIANDAHSNYELGVPSLGISTRGTVLLAGDACKIEEGIGMHADGLLTLDLDEIRAAGRLERQTLRFLCDRAGINDDQIRDRKAASVYMAVLLSDSSARVSSAFINGRRAAVVERNGVWSLTGTPGKPLRADGNFVSFSLPISADCRYLTLVSTSAGDGIMMDHAVWSGARLMVVP